MVGKFYDFLMRQRESDNDNFFLEKYGDEAESRAIVQKVARDAHIHHVL